MKLVVKLLLFSFFLISCTNQKENVKPKVVIELLNNEVNFVAIDSNKLIKSEIKTFEELKSYSDEERIKACNILTFKIINNSDKKYYFVLNMNEFNFFGNSNDYVESKSRDTISIRRMCYLIDNKKIKQKQINSSYSYSNFPKFENDSMNIYTKKYLEIERKINIDNYQSFADEASVNHSFVIYPGEYKMFKKKLFLPIDVEKDKNHFFSFSALILSPEDQYDFSLGISADKNDIWNSLHDFQRKEIKDNGYEIFDGVVISNKVPLKMLSVSIKESNK